MIFDINKEVFCFGQEHMLLSYFCVFLLRFIEAYISDFDLCLCYDCITISFGQDFIG